MYAPQHPELFRHFLEHLPFAVAMVDQQMRYLAVSQQWLQVHGLEDSDLIGCPCPVEAFQGTSLQRLPNYQESQEHRLALVSETSELLSTNTVSSETFKLLSQPWQQPNGEIGGIIFTLFPTSVSSASEKAATISKREDSLKEREELFTTTFEQAAVGIAHCDINGQFMRVNRKFSEITGYTSEDLLACSWRDITNPEDVEVDSELSRALVAGKIDTYSLEKRYTHKQGFSVWINLTVSFVREPDGTPKYLIKVIEDIQNRKAAEAKLHQSEAKLKAAQQMAHVGNWEFDVATQQIIWSDEIFRIFGLSSSNSVPTYEEHLQFIHPDDRIDWESHIRAAITEGTSYAFEYRIIKNDGTIRYLYGQGEAEKRGETVVRLFGTVLDITERKTAEIALQQANQELENRVEERTAELKQTIEKLESEIAYREQAEAQLWQTQRRYYTLTQLLPVGISHTDLQGNSLYVNERWCDISGITLEEAIGDQWAKSIHPEDRARVFAEWQQVTRKKVRFQLDFRFLKPSGKVVWVMSQFVAETDETGKILGYVGAITDITERKEIEETLLRISKAVESTSDAIGMSDATGTHIYQNQAFSELYEWETVEELNAGGGMAAIFAGSAVAQNIFDTLISGHSWSGEIEQRSRSGRIIQVLLRANAIKDQTGKILGIISITTDISNRKALEKELAEQQALLNTFIANAPFGIAILDSQLRYLQINETLAEINGVPVADHKGKTLREVLPVIGSELEPFYEWVLTEGQPLLNVEVSGETPKMPGVTRSWLSSYLPLRLEDGRPIALGVFVIEITERKRVEAELQQQAQLLDQLYDSVITTDLEGIVTRWNKGAERIYGYTAAEAIGQPMTFLYPPDQHERLQTQILPILNERGSYEGEFKAQRKYGEVFDILLSLSLQTDSEGAVIGTIGYGIDITERKRIDAERRATAQQLAIVIQQTPLAVLECTAELNVMAWNPAAERIFGYSAGEAIGRSLFGLILAETSRENIEQIQAGLLTLKGGYHAINENITKDGRTLICEWYNTPLVDEWGLVVGIMTLGLDITERVQAEAALRESEAQFRTLAQREELVNRLTRQIRQSLNLSEILKTTVNAIRELLEVERCHFSWYRPEGIQNEAVIFNAPCWETVQESRLPGEPSRLGVYPAREVGPLGQKIVDFAEEICIDDFTTFDEPVFQQFLRTHEIASFMSFPVHTRTGEVGVIACIRSPHPHPWRDSERELLRAITAQLAIAIDQAGLYEQTSVAAATAQAKSVELEKALRELQQTQSQLIQSEKMSSLGQMVAGVAHEINNPVSFIYGNISPAQEYACDLLKVIQLYQDAYPHPPVNIEDEIRSIDLEFLADDLPKLLDSMKVGAERIQEIVRSLRNFSRLDEAQMKDVNIHEGIDSTLMILNSRLRANSDCAAIEVIKEYGDLPLIECYAGQLNQVFMNLISNAIDALEEERKEGNYSNKQPQIRIGTSLAGKGKVSICIADNGTGISDSVRSKLFDPFFTTKPVGKGTGLGLTISYQIVVEKHKGTLHCVSKIGQGTEFNVQIPIHQQTPKI